MSNEWSKKVFARNLKYYMDRANETQKELAEVAGVTEATFSEYINAKKYPRIDKIQRLADHFGILKSALIEDNSRGGAQEQGCELFLHCHGQDAYETVKLLLQLDENDRAEIRGEIKQMLKADKYQVKKELKHA